MPKIKRNSDARQFVISRTEFTTPRYFSRQMRGMNGGQFYAVFSYGLHFPLWVYDYESAQWIVNSDKYSHTTSRQRNFLAPQNPNATFPATTQELRNILAL